MRKDRVFGAILMMVLMMGLLGGCGHKEKYLDPDDPITVSIWHYYNGTVKNRFDELVAEFNETTGMEQGVVIDAQSYGDVSELADAVFASANKDIGAQPMPDIFAAYPDNAFRVDKIVELVDMETYFSEKELGEIRKEFLEEGRFGEGEKLKILPIAKSTENLYLNKTYWDQFAEETGAKINDLSTWEGIMNTAELYYRHTGKAFFCIDSNANFMLLASKQLGQELYLYQNDRAVLNLSEETAYKIWESYYLPFLKGYYAKSGRFCSDDAKTGKIIAYTGSTAGASYFPTEVTEGEETVPVEVMTLPYPYFRDGKPYAIQQGAGMCIAKSDQSHEYGAALFLKWFIHDQQNEKFAVSTAYFPVKNAVLKEDTLLKEVEENDISIAAIRQSISTTMKMLDTYTLYGSRPFENSFNMRSLLETSLFDYTQEKLQLLNDRVAGDETKNAVIEELSSKEYFYEWYNKFKEEASQILTD